MNRKFEVNLDIIKKYDRPGPRYTSYPTAPHFHENFGPIEYREAIIESNSSENPSDISLYFHLPFCETQCWYCACNNIVTKNRARIDAYLEDLKKEIQMLSNMTNPSRKVVQLHWGGGTPTYLTPQQIEDLYLFIKDHFNLANDAEVSMEIDPRRLSPEHLPTIRRIGFNRVSFGVQDFHVRVQEAVNRIQPEALSRKVVEESRALGFDSINIDLIYGLPHQTLESYQQTLDKITEISPDRLAVFNFAHVPWLKRHQKLLKPEDMPKPEEKLQILKSVIERLTAAGYVFIGMDHFAKPDDELSVALQNRTLYRNFQGYTTRSGAEVFALGITSISQLHNAYAQNAKNTDEYRQILSEENFPIIKGFQLSEDDKLRRELITELMCNNRVVKGDFEEKYNIDFNSYFADEIEQLDEFIEDELLENNAEMISVSEPGRLVIRNIAMAFDSYLDKDRQSKQPIYSRTV